MEYAPGGSLANYIEQHKRSRNLVAESDVWKFSVQLLAALHTIHCRRIVHRDIKPQNLFLGSDGSIKIGDFGVSRILSSSRDLATTVVGSPGYLSPELCKGEPYGEKADIWAMGVTLSELCALRHPYGDVASQAALIMKIVNADPPSVPSIYSPRLVRLLFDCMQRRPDFRPSAHQLLLHSNVQQIAVQLRIKAALSSEVHRIQAEILGTNEPHARVEAWRRPASPHSSKFAPIQNRMYDDLPTHSAPISRRAASVHGASAQGVQLNSTQLESNYSRTNGEGHVKRVNEPYNDAAVNIDTLGGDALPTTATGSWDLRPVRANRKQPSARRSVENGAANKSAFVSNNRPPSGDLNQPKEPRGKHGHDPTLVSPQRSISRLQSSSPTVFSPSWKDARRPASSPSMSGGQRSPGVRLLALQNGGWGDVSASPLDTFSAKFFPRAALPLTPTSRAERWVDSSPLRNLVSQEFPRADGRIDPPTRLSSLFDGL